jgi:DNA-binding winged helix-turn-helix (wHTH) protein
MSTAIAPAERDFRRDTCDERCQVIAALLPGRFGRSELLLHDPDAHERAGRRQMGDPELLIATGPLVLDVEGAGVTVDGRAVHPSAIELRLLFALSARLGRVVTTEHLASTVWGTAVLDTTAWDYRHTLRVAMARLRRRLYPAGGMIATRLGVGYRLEAVPPGDPPPLPSSQHPHRVDGWSLRWAACRSCGLTDLPHASNGRCTSCYGSDGVRERRGRVTAGLSVAAARRLGATMKEDDR